jgi:hypothetical protein
MPILLATKITLLDIFIATMVLKVLIFIFIFYVARLIKHEDDLRDAAAAPALLHAAPTKRVAIVACPFCGCECAASVRKEEIAETTVYELICWECHAALPETALVSLIEPTEWLKRSAGSTQRAAGSGAPIIGNNQ